MKFTMREYAIGLGLKLTHKKNLRKCKPGDICVGCGRHIDEVSEIMYVVLAYRPLYAPIVTPNYTITQIPYVLHKFCIPCSRNEFPDSYKKE